MLRKLKNIGRRKKLKKVNLNKLRYQILLKAKEHVSKCGWSDKLFYNIAAKSKFKFSEIAVLFPEGYITLLEMYLDTVNNQMTEDSKKINLIRLRVHERVKELVILRLKIMSREKELISKTYFHLLLPQNFKIASRCLYKAVDQIWFVAGDNSTDFNFYSKRAILASIYSMVMLHYVNNNSLDQTIELLNKQLKRVSKIPKIKNRLGDITKTISQIFKLVKNIRPIKQ